MKNNNLSWSYSRATLLYYCAKKYYFNYYTNYFKTFDWDFYRECLTVKRLTSLNMRVGNIVHGMISDYLNLLKENGANAENIKILEQKTIKEIEEQYQKSKVRDFENYDSKENFGLSEHFYGENIDDKFEESKIKVLKYFHNFLGSDLHDKIQELIKKSDKVFIEPKIPDFDMMKYQIENITELKGIVLRAQPDLGFILKSEQKENTTYIIYDRKTGKVPDKPSDEISEQLKIYAYKMLLKIGKEKFDEVDIFCYEVFVKEMKIFGNKIEKIDIENIESKIIQDVVEQKKLIINQNPIKNQPLPVENFKRTDNEYKCKFCRFRKVCGELKNYESNLEPLFT